MVAGAEEKTIKSQIIELKATALPQKIGFSGQILIKLRLW